MRKLLIFMCLAGFCFGITADDVKACEGGNATSCVLVDEAYCGGTAGMRKGLKVSFTKVEYSQKLFEYYKKACESGNATSCGKVGHYYSMGQVVEQDQTKALEYYKKGCDGGDVDNCHTVISYLWQDHTKALEYRKKACDGGGAYFCGEVGEAYEKGEGVKQDHIKAVEYRKKACEGRGAKSCGMVGLAYSEGQGVEKDYLKSTEYYQKAFEYYKNGYGGGMYVGRYYLAYCNDVGVKDYSRAFKYDEKDCDSGNLFGCSMVGFAYYDGKIVKQDSFKAFEYSKKGCDGGDPFGCGMVGLAYSKGQGVKKDYLKSTEYYKKAFEYYKQRSEANDAVEIPRQKR
jgi:TPR repeat protein